MVHLRLGMAVAAVALAVVGASAIWGVGRAPVPVCYSSSRHYVPQPKEGPGRPPACPLRKP
jgi:hypothetical protein